MPLLAQVTPAPTPSPVPSPAPTVTVTPPASVGEATGLVWESVVALWQGFVANIPLILVGLAVLGIGFLVSRLIGDWARRGIRRAGADNVVAGLTERLVRILVLVLAVLLGLSIAGVSVSAALAGLGIAGLAVALALQGILENFVAGLIIILRKPFRAGDEVEIDDHVGVVTDIDLRTTRIRDFDGELVIIPNTTVFEATLVNRTHSTTRRSSIAVGVDYRDDHDAVGELLRDAVHRVDGVLEEPAVQVVCTELGESSVNFEVRFWTAPRNRDAVATTDRVLRTTKTALDTNGFTIPWPIRTLVVDPEDDNVVRHRDVGTS